MAGVAPHDQALSPAKRRAETLHRTQNSRKNQQFIMAEVANTAPVANGVHEQNKLVELAFDLPHSPGLRVNLHLTVKISSIILFLTSTSSDSSQSAASMGSFVYAMPDVSSPI